MLISITTGQRGKGRRSAEVRTAQILRMRTLADLKAERLEDRIALAMSTWSGAVDNFWSTPGNWDTPPVAGDNLVFPAAAVNKTSVNDLAAGIAYQSVFIDGAGYAISGSPIQIDTALTSFYNSGESSVQMDLTFTDMMPGIAVVFPDSTLTIGSRIFTANTLSKSGQGALKLLNVAQTYTADTVINAGNLELYSTLAGGVRLEPGTRLNGNGTMGALISSGGTVDATGLSGILIVNGGVQFDSDTTFRTSLRDPALPASFAASGPVVLNSPVLNATLNHSPVGGEVYTIIDNRGSDPVAGSFAGLPQDSLITIDGQTFRIDYLGGDGNDVTLTQQISTTTSLTSNVNPSVYGQTVTLSAEVTSASGTPVGSVAFYDGATVLTLVPLDAAGKATYSTSSLIVGTRNLTAVYLGNGNFLSSTSTVLNQVVNQAETMVTLTGLPNPSQLGQAVSLTAKVQAKNPGSGVPGGTVVFVSGGAIIGTGAVDSAGDASLVVSSLPLGTNLITAEYQGDSRYLSSTSTEYPQVVNKIGTTTTVISSANPANPGANVTFTATVAVAQGFPTAVGSVNFLNGSTILATVPLDAQGKATYSTSTLPIGTNSITVSYAGDGTYGASTSSVLSQVINKVSTTTTLTAVPNPSNFGGGVVLTATVTPGVTGYPAPTGTVQFLNGTTVLGTVAVDTDGKATLNVSNLAVGTQTLTATYQGDSNNATSTSTAVSQVVNKASTTVTLTPSTNYVSAAGMVTFTAKVTPSESGLSTVPTGQIRFLVNGVAFAVKTLTDGEATFTANGFQLGLGIDTVQAEYLGDTNFSTANSSDVTLVSGTDNERWLNQVFLQVTSQPIDYQSLVKWNDRLQRGSSRACVVTKIRNTPLGRQMLVQQSFNEYLGRDGSEEEIRMVQGAAQRTRTSTRAIVLGTPEFYDQVGDGTPEGFVTALETVLGTTFSPRESAGIVHQINAGEPHFKVAEHVLTSRTGRRALIQQMFQQVLGRDATERELAAFSWQETRGVYWRQQQSYLLASRQFYEKAIAMPGTMA